MLVVKGLRNYPHIQRAADWGRPRVRDSVAEGKWRGVGWKREGFPYLNSKYLASRATTSLSGSQSDFRDLRAGRRSRNRDLANKEERRFSSPPVLGEKPAISRLIGITPQLVSSIFPHANRDRHVHLNCRGSRKDRSPVMYPRWTSQT